MIARSISSARKPHSANGLTALDFLNRVYIPQRLHGKANRVFRESLTWFERYLEKQPSLADISLDNLSGLQSHLAKLQLSPSRIRQIKAALSSIAKHAWRLGILHFWQPIPLRSRHITRVALKNASFLRSVPSSGTLRHAFENQLREKLVAECTKNRVNMHLAALNQFDLLIARYSTPDDLTPENLKSFQELLSKRGNSESLFFSYRACLRRLARIIHPQDFKDARKKHEPLPEPQPGTIRSFFENDYRPLQMLDASPRFLIDMRSTFRQLYYFLGRDVRLEELNDSFAADFFGWLMKTRDVKPITVNGHRARLFSVWRFAVERGLIAKEPKVRKLRVENDVPDAWTEEETLRFIEAPKLVTWRKLISDIPAAKFFRALLLVAYWTGLRRGSILSIRRKDLNLKTGWLNIPGNGMKNRQGKQFRLGGDALSAIAEIWQPERELLFPWNHDMRHFDRQMRRIFDASGVAPSFRRSMSLLHKMRRTVGTLTAAKKGLNAACDLLGHSSESVTKRYVDPSKLPGNDATQWLPNLSLNQVAPITVSQSETDKPWLEQAYTLFHSGYVVAAAVLGRIALEDGLRVQMSKRKINPKPPGNIESRLETMSCVGCFDRIDPKALRSALKLVNKAAHGARVDHLSVSESLATIGELLKSLE